MQDILKFFCERVKSQVSQQKVNVLQQQSPKVCFVEELSLPSKKHWCKQLLFQNQHHAENTGLAIPGAQLS